MKQSVKAILIASSCLLSANSAIAKETSRPAHYVGDLQYASFCRAVVLDDVRVLRASLSRQVGRIAGSHRAVLRRVTEEDGLKCNGESLIDFSKSRNASNVFAYLTYANR